LQNFKKSKLNKRLNKEKGGNKQDIESIKDFAICQNYQQIHEILNEEGTLFRLHFLSFRSVDEKD